MPPKIMDNAGAGLEPNLDHRTMISTAMRDVASGKLFLQNAIAFASVWSGRMELRTGVYDAAPNVAWNVVFAPPNYYSRMSEYGRESKSRFRIRYRNCLDGDSY